MLHQRLEPIPPFETGFQLLARLAYLYRPKEKLTVSQWAERYMPHYDAEVLPFLAEIMDACGDPETSEVGDMPANWTYAGTSPKDVAARATDHPSATVYIYEDGTLHKFVGCRGSIQDMGGQTARPGFATFNLMGIYPQSTRPS